MVGSLTPVNGDSPGIAPATTSLAGTANSVYVRGVSVNVQNTLPHSRPRSRRCVSSISPRTISARMRMPSSIWASVANEKCQSQRVVSGVAGKTGRAWQVLMPLSRACGKSAVISMPLGTVTHTKKPLSGRVHVVPSGICRCNESSIASRRAA